mmetsp:Transcript_34897/g.109611  ORF Transcript_34897/g.109611 Transcript_34897/m.109611 type:complete len:159 (-) Transcript_34897:456-932(-)
MRMILDADLKDEYKAKLKEVQKEVKVYDREYKAAKAEADRNRLGLGSGIGSGGGPQTNDATLSAANGVLDKVDESYANTVEMIGNARQVADATEEELKRQDEQLDSIYSELQGIDNNLLRAQKLIHIFSRRMATDKCIQCFAVSPRLIPNRHPNPNQT